MFGSVLTRSLGTFITGGNSISVLGSEQSAFFYILKVNLKASFLSTNVKIQYHLRSNKK